MDTQENKIPEMASEQSEMNENMAVQETGSDVQKSMVHQEQISDHSHNEKEQISEITASAPEKRSGRKKETTIEESSDAQLTENQNDIIDKDFQESNLEAEQAIVNNLAEIVVEKQITDSIETLENQSQIQPEGDAIHDIISENAESKPVSEQVEMTVSSVDENVEKQLDEALIKKSVKKAETIEQSEPLITEEQIKECSLKELIAITEKVLEHEDFLKIKDAILIIKNRFDQIKQDPEQVVSMKTSENAEDEEVQVEELEKAQFNKQVAQFEQLMSRYSKLRKQYNERLEAEKLRNYDRKKKILEDLKQLIESEETLQKSWEDFKRLQQQWKEIGHVPPAKSQDLWNSFNHLVDLFLDKVKINRELRDLDYRKNLEAKIEICEKIEELLLYDSMEEAFKRLGELQNLWREIGPVPSDKREEINGRFAAAIERLKEKRREKYETFRKELEQNLEVKRALVTQIKAINEQEIQSARDWTKKTEEVEELMKIWKNTGAVPKKYNEELWNEFRQEMNRFFSEKKAFFKKLKDEQMENYQRKQLLCKQAEALQESTDWKKATQELIALQNEWKTIGPVPHKYSDAIWKQFRVACDTFFARKKEYFANIDKIEEENLLAKQKLIEEMNAFEFGEDNHSNLNVIKEFQRRFVEIGRVPLKDKDEIQKRFQKTVDNLLEKLKIAKEEKRKFELKQRYEAMINTKAGQEELRKESFNLAQKISKLDADIQLWENNIEFFAKSKNAELLTREFREKIERAKAELLILKEKQKILKNKIG